MRPAIWTASNTVALAAVLAGVALAALAARRARSLDELPEPATARARSSVALAGTPLLRTDRLEQAAAQDPFRADRQPAPIRFPMPGDAPVGPVGATAGAPTPPPAPAIVLTGTSVLSGGRGFAAIALGDHPARLVRVGDTLAGVRLRSVSRGKAVVVFRDSVITLELRRPGSTPR